MKKITLLLLLFTSYISFSQDVSMQNGTVSQCSGTFYDSGGAAGNYGSNESYVFTICPGGPGQRVQVDFTQFSTQLNLDVLTIYDGDSTAANAFGTYSGATSPGFVSASPDNPTGCLTFEFTSNGSGTTTGWAATISCITPCQTINSQLDSATPAPNALGYIRVCPNDPITLVGSATFSVDGTGATYEWDLGDGNTMAGQTATFSYATPGVYIVNLSVRDANTSIDPLGCTNNNLINQVVQVATEPDFTGTEAAQSVLCFGESTTIDGVVAPVEFINDCTPPVSDTTFLPDGNGVAYETSVTVDCYDSAQTLTDINQIVSICLTMEHSYLGDLDISIISPNGQQITLKNYPGGGSANLGTPWATGAVDGNSANTTPGIGAQYCFVPGNTNPTMVGGIVTGGTFPNGNGPGTYTDSYVPAGNYRAEESFTGLLGSPLNGDWTIRVVDNLGLDNGYIFQWSIEFDPNLQPPELSFTPVITSEAWDADATITNTSGNTITVQPPTAGTFCYTYRVTDDFGCEYTQDVCIDVLPEIVTLPPNNLFLCNPGAAPYIFDLTQNTSVILANAPNPTDLVVTYYETQADADAATNPIATPGTYSGTNGQVIYVRVEYQTSGCYEVETFTLNITAQPTINPVPDLEQCDDASNDGFEQFDLESQTLGILGAQPASDFQVTYYTSFANADTSTGALVSPYTNVSNPQPIYVRIERISDASCNNVSPLPLFNLVINPSDDASFSMTPTCDGATATLMGTVGGTYTFNPAPVDAAVIDPNTGTVTGGTSGTSYTVQYTTSGICPLSSTVSFTVITTDDASFSMTPTCDGATATITGTTGGTFAFNPAPVDAAVIDPNTGTVTGGTSGTSYTVEYTTLGACPSSSTQTFAVITTDDPSFTMTPTCDGGTATITGTTGGTFALNPVPTDGATIDGTTGTVTGGTSGTSYTIEYTTLGTCPASSTQNVTVLTTDDASFTVTPNCTGGTATITGNLGGTFSFNPAPADAAVIDSNTGTVTGGTPSASYTIQYTTSGVCSATSTQVLNVLPVDDSSFTMTPTCDGGTATISGLVGGAFVFNPVPTDGAVIDDVTGNVTGATPGVSYTVEYTTNGSCPSTSIVTFTVNPLPTVIAPTNLAVCDDNVPDGLTSIDLSIKNVEISGGNPSYNVSYYVTQGDADSGSNALAIPYTNTSNPQQVYVRVENSTTGCYDTTVLTLEVEQAPVANVPTPLAYCDPDSDGFGVFTLTDVDTEITGGVAGLTVSYHETMADAENDVNALISPYNNIVANTQTVYARVESATIATDCATIVPLVLIVNPTPQLGVAPTALEVCDDISADGIAQFDLTSKESEILQNLSNPSQYTVSYYATQAGAAMASNAIATQTTTPIRYL
ncbi:MAG: PKD domain-containing protein [Gelidibacter sp.]